MLVLSLISPLLLISIAVLYLARYLLRVKFKPNKESLTEFKKLKINKLLNFINIIIILAESMIWWNGFFNVFLLIILLLITELIRNKYILVYLRNKNESTSTQKYIAYDLSFKVMYMVVLSRYVIKSIIGFMFLSSGW